MAHYFFLLRKILDILNPEQREELKKLFMDFKPDIINSKSLVESMKTINKISETLSKKYTKEEF